MRVHVRACAHACVRLHAHARLCTRECVRSLGETAKHLQIAFFNVAELVPSLLGFFAFGPSDPNPTPEYTCAEDTAAQSRRGREIGRASCRERVLLGV